MISENHIGLFAKFWQPGQVKTRLATLGIHAASEIYFEFLSHLLTQLKSSGHFRSIVFSPDQRREEFRQLAGPEWNLVPQADGDLGNRLRAFFATTFLGNQTPDLVVNESIKADGVSRKIIVIGSDCPLIQPALLESAFEKLDQCPAVIGPSTDGGYYLIGLRQQCDNIFQNIAWSTSSVCLQTMAALREHQIDFDLLPEMTDVDDIDDFHQLMRILSAPFAAPDTTTEKLRLRLSQICPGR